MIQVRCPECGFLQTISEERFLTLPSDFLTCPHCHARVPKEWQPVESENMPEEARHKMLAFSRRILNGGDVNRDMVYALESLVRHYGPLEDSAKALGIGYARLGETRKAEEFLALARNDAPADRDILSSLLQVRLEEQDFDDAVSLGQALIEASAGAAHDEDIARLVLALVGADRRSEARALISSYPGLDHRHALVREARRQVNRAGKLGIRSILSRWASLNRVFGGRSSDEEDVSSRHFRRSLEPRDFADEPFVTSPIDSIKQTPADTAAGTDRGERPSRAVADYWIYAAGEVVPRWESIRDRIAARSHEAEGTVPSIEMLRTLLDRKEMSIDYVSREEAPALFEYPDDLIPRNSRQFSDADRQTLQDARMIARVRASLTPQAGVDHLRPIMYLAEAVREEMRGVVQDAISYVLWGADAWKRVVDGDSLDLLGTHLRFEALEENGLVWIHTHGMAKFGMPDVEMEGVPDEFASTGMKLVTMMARGLIRASQQKKVNLSATFHLEGTPVLFRLKRHPGDEEGHFPAGSVKVYPYVADHDPTSPATTRHVLRMLTRKPSPEARPEQPVRRKTRTPAAARPESHESILRQRVLEAHRRSLTEFPAFKKRFQDGGLSPRHVFAVKAGFPLGENAYEWMWVSVDAWRGGTIVGFLENEPTARKDLHRGSRVQIAEREVFDWAITRDGAIAKGAYTERVMAQKPIPAVASVPTPAPYAEAMRP